MFFKINLTNVYYCIRIKEGDEWKTVFRIWYSYFEYLVILFSLMNISVTF